MQQYVWLLVPQTGTNYPKFGHLLMDYKYSSKHLSNEAAEINQALTHCNWELESGN